MKLSFLGSFLGMCLAGAATALLYTGASAQFSGASAQEGCIVTLVQFHEKRCPEGVTLETTAAPEASAPEASAPEAVEPAVTPTAAAPEDCIKTDILLHEKRCPPGV
ncbi:hypothetical protein [Taklimakanibacter deserti]|uniref:hypothetical protein n=1 Tax=Taklimakanibacter deserti TaxID=2267839 RepID=UPI0013C4B7BE